MYIHYMFMLTSDEKAIKLKMKFGKMLKTARLVSMYCTGVRVLGSGFVLRLHYLVLSASVI